MKLLSFKVVEGIASFLNSFGLHNEMSSSSNSVDEENKLEEQKSVNS